MELSRWKWFYRAGLVFMDGLLIYFSFYLAYQIRFFYAPFLNIFPVVKGTPQWFLYQEALRAVIPIWILIFSIWGRLYQVRFPDAADEFLRIAKSVTLSTFL